MRQRTVLVTWDIHELICQMAEKEDIEVESAYQESGIWKQRYVREVALTCKFLKKEMLYNKKLKNISGRIILFDAMIHIEFVKWLIENNPDARIIFWYWNNESGYRISPQELKKLSCEVWSFNQRDCDKWKLNYNSQFYCSTYFDENIVDVTKIKCTHDLVFIGRNKGRNAQIEQTFCQLEGVELYCYYVCNNILDWKGWKLHKPLSYQEYLQEELQGRAILDWVADTKYGLSLRVMEALYFQKKLVTNNVDIINYDFYNHNNIFVIGKDQLDQLTYFLGTPYEKTSEEIRMKYNFTEWLSRFGE